MSPESVIDVVTVLRSSPYQELQRQTNHECYNALGDMLIPSYVTVSWSLHGPCCPVLSVTATANE